MHNRFVIRFHFPSIRICIDANQIKICVVQIREKKCSKFAQRSFNLANNGDVIAQYRYSSIQIHFGAFYLTRWAFKFAYITTPVDFINQNPVFSFVVVFMNSQLMRAKVFTILNNINFPGQFRNFVDQIHFTIIQFRRFGSCTTDSSFDFIFPAFEFALTLIKSNFVSFKFEEKKCSKFAQRSFNLANNGNVIAQYRYSSIQIHFGAFYLTRWAFKFAYITAPVDFINHNSVFSLVVVFMNFQLMRAKVFTILNNIFA